MFDLAFDNELRGCDVVRLKGMTVDRYGPREGNRTSRPIGI
jgi:hypothetical protein